MISRLLAVAKVFGMIRTCFIYCVTSKPEEDLQRDLFLTSAFLLEIIAIFTSHLAVYFMLEMTSL